MRRWGHRSGGDWWLPWLDDEWPPIFFVVFFFTFLCLFPLFCVFFPLFYLVYCSLNLLNVLIPVAKIYLSKWEIIFPDLPHWWLAKGGWWLLSRCHLSSPWNSLPIATNPCTTVPTLHLQIQRGNVGSVFFIFFVCICQANIHPTTHCQMSIGEYRRGINNPACSESIHVTGWKGNITLEVVKLVTDYYAPCIWILWMLCPLYNMNSLDIMHPVWKYFGYLI